MNMTLLGVLLMLIIAGICGAIGRAIAGSTRGGMVVSVAVGFIGALVGGHIAHALGLPESFTLTVEGHAFPIVWSIVGAALFVAVIHLVFGAGRRRYGYA